MTNVFTEPRRIRNCSLFNLPVISEPIIAAWLEPRPGKNEQIGETRIVAIVGFMISLLLMSNLSIPCFGIIVLDFIEWIIVEVPKRPVNNGRRGWFMLEFNVDSPRNPAKIKIRTAFVLDSFSLYIRKIEIQIRKNAIMRWKKGYILGIVVMNIGIIRVREIIAIVEPRSVSFTARWPSPFVKSSCPGRTPNPVSSSGAPRKIDGIKSMNV